jgi:hypothetical protein
MVNKKDVRFNAWDVIILAVCALIFGKLGAYFGFGAILGGALGGLIAFLLIMLIKKIRRKNDSTNN